MDSRRLTINLPVDVWDRLDEEASEHDQKIGAYLRSLVLARDAKRQGR